MDVDYEFRWNAWNIEHIGGHGVSTEEAEHLVRHAARGYPQFIGDGKYLVKGQGPDGCYLQVIYVFSPADIVFVIRARPLTDPEKRRLRRGRRT